MSAMTFGILFRHSHPRGRAPFGADQKEHGLWGRECIPGREIVFVQRMLVREGGGGGERLFQGGGVCFLGGCPPPLPFETFW